MKSFKQFVIEATAWEKLSPSEMHYGVAIRDATKEALKFYQSLKKVLDKVVASKPDARLVAEMKNAATVYLSYLKDIQELFQEQHNLETSGLHEAFPAMSPKDAVHTSMSLGLLKNQFKAVKNHLEVVMKFAKEVHDEGNKGHVRIDMNKMAKLQNLLNLFEKEWGLMEPKLRGVKLSEGVDAKILAKAKASGALDAKELMALGQEVESSLPISVDSKNPGVNDLKIISQRMGIPFAVVQRALKKFNAGE